MKRTRLSVYMLIVFITSIQAQTNTFPATGNVGIGTLSPGAALHVNGNIIFQYANVGIQFRDPANSNNFQMGLATSAGAYSRFAQPGDFVFGKVNTPGNIYISNFQNGAINFTTGINSSSDNIIMSIKGNNVGIGTTTPANNLQVIGSFQTNNSNTATNNGIIINAGNTNTAASTNVNRIRFGGSDANANYFTIQGVGNVDYLTINNGNVLIGKTSQTNTGYKLDVNGNIRADKLVVNSTGADYVFDSSYKLLSLKELGNFIQQNHHLPQIASANEMQANGIDVGGNQTILLQKTEELTLYIIQQNKIINGQNTQIQSLESRLSILDQRLHLLENKLNQ